MNYTLANYVRSTLAVAAGATDTSLVVALAAPPLQDPPAASASAPGVLLLQDAVTTPSKIEIVTYTGRSVDGSRVTLTGVTRGQEGTTGQTWDVGTPTFSGVTAGMIMGAFPKSGGTIDGDVTIEGTIAASNLGTASAKDVEYFAAAANAVPNTRTVNGKALSSNVTLTASDVGAATSADGALARSAVQPGTTPTFDDVSVSGPAGSTRPVFWQTSGVNRWVAYANTSAESGDNAGSNLSIGRYNDDGSGLDVVVTFGRSDKSVYFSGALTAAGSIAASNLAGTNTGDQDLSGYALKSSLGTAAAKNVGDFASAAQGSKADAAMPRTGGTFSGSVAFGSGVTFGSQVAASTTDLSKHLALYSTTYGVSVTANTISIVTGGQVAASFTSAGIATQSITLGGGKKLSKITVSSSSPGTLADGELYLQY